jgi:hypothetical protein
LSILDKLFGKRPKSADPDGIYFYIQCDHCGEKLRIRADRRHDLMRDYETGTLVWKKEIMDARCFRILYAQVEFDAKYRITSQQIEGEGHFISQEEFEV